MRYYLWGGLLLLLACQSTPERQPAPFTSSSYDEITYPPAYFGLGDYYYQYLDANGIPIFAGIEIPEQAIRRVQQNVQAMLQGEAQLRRRLIDNYVRIVILALIDELDTLPEFQGMTFEPGQRSRVGEVNLAIAVVPEENILCFPNDPSEGEDVFVRTFALTILNTAIPLIEPSFADSLQSRYQQAREAGRWDSTLAARSPADYFAEGVQTWFNVNRESALPDGEHNQVDSRLELAAYDPGLYALVARFFAEEAEVESCSL